MTGVFDILQMKKEDVLTFLPTETHFHGGSLDFKMKQSI